MKKGMIVAAILIAAGCLLIGGALMAWMIPGGWDFTGFSTVSYETNRHEIQEDFQNISIATDTADIEFIPSEGDAAVVECRDQENLYHRVSVVDGTLTIKLVDERKWYEHIGISFENTKVTVYMPRGEYGALIVDSDTGDVEIPADFGFESMNISQSTGDVQNRASTSGDMKIRTTTGRIRLEGVSAAALELTVSTGHVTVTDVVCGSMTTSGSTGKLTATNVTCAGDVSIRVTTGDAELANITCGNLVTRGSTGDLIMMNLIASGSMSIERDTGDVNFEACDAAELTITTDTGRVAGSLLSDKVFLVRSDTGRIEVPESITGGKCSVTTDTGDIRLRVIE